MDGDKDDEAKKRLAKEKAKDKAKEKADKVKRDSYKMKLLIVLAALATYATAFVPSMPIRSATSVAFGMSDPPSPEGKFINTSFPVLVPSCKFHVPVLHLATPPYYYILLLVLLIIIDNDIERHKVLYLQR